MNKSESIKNIAAALVKFQEEVKNPPKSADNPFFKSKYTPLDVIVDTVKPLLGKQGLSYIQSPGGDGEKISITTLIMHISGEWIETDPLVLKADKANAQGAGSAITYARRYALAAALGIASDEDDDGNGASGNKDKEQPSKPQQSQGYKITEKQLNRLYAIAKSAGYDSDKVKESVLKRYKVEITSLSKTQYEELCKGFDSMKLGVANGN